MAVETSEIPDFKKEFSRNLFSNSLFFVINIFIGLLIVPFYIDKLGLAAYGIIPLATSFSSYMMLVLDSLNGAISRFLTIRIQRSDVPGASKVFNTSLFTIIGLIAVSVPFLVVVAWFTPDFFKVSGIERISVFVLFVLIFASSLINGLQSPFSAVFYSLNKIYYSNYIGVFRTLTSTAIIVILLLVANPSVYYVGLAYFLAAVFSLILTITLSRQVYDKIHISVTHFSKEQFYEIITLTKWILVDQIGTLLLLQLSLIMVNIKFGTAVGGEYAIVLLLFNLVWGITGLVLTVLNPMYYTYYARGLYESMQNLSIVSVKFVGLVMALPIALICVFSPQLLTIWVGERFAHLSTLVWIFLFPLTMIVAFRPLILNCAALNKVRVPAVYTIIAGILNLFLAVILTSVFDWGVYGITLAFILALSIRGMVFIPWYAARIQEVPPLRFYRPIVPSVLAFLVLVTLGLSAVYVFTIPASILHIGVISGGVSLVYLIIVNRIILTRADRELIRSILPPYVAHILPPWAL